MNDLTEIQRDIPTRMLGRDLDGVNATLHGCFQTDLIDEIQQRMKWDEEVVVLDVACGVGNAIEEIVRVGPALIEDRSMMRGRIRGIGIDLNPLPDLIPGKILSMDPSADEQKSCKKSGPLAEFRKDDLRTLVTVPDASVDVLYSVGGLAYVDDCLRALEAGWRVLRDGGIMAYEVPDMLISEPYILNIIKETPGAADIFSIRKRPSAYCTEYDFIVGEKKQGNSFRGFPYRMTESTYYVGKGAHTPHFRHVMLGRYERI